jgi:hypothetical protein
MLSRHSLAWILSLVLSAGSPEYAAWKGMVLPYSVFLVLGAAASARAVAHNSYLSLSEYSNAVLYSGLWRPAMEAGSQSGICTSGAATPWKETSALFLSYVFVNK